MDDKKRIARDVQVQCSLIPGATFYNAAEMAIDAFKSNIETIFPPSASPAALTGQPCEGIAGELPRQTVGKLTAHIRALQASAPRFFIDHGVIHDRLTGRHMHGDRDVEPGVADEAVAMLNDLHARALLAASPADQGEDARDAARLDWLIGHIWIDEIDALPPIPFTDSVEEHRRNVRAAIDAAMSATPPAGEKA